MYTVHRHIPMMCTITQTCPCNEHLLKPHFYIEILGYAGVYLFLAHLSRRLIGELIVYPCFGVRPSSTISKILFSETAGPIVLILHIHHLQVGGKNNCVFCFDRIRTLVAMATYASHRLTMEKNENCQFLLSCWRYLNFVFAEM